MNKPVSASGESLEHGRPIVFRNGIVLTMDDDNKIVKDCDVLVVDGVIREVGPGIKAPDDALEIDARGGIIMPGMVDTHRHMWQTAMRAYGADWTLSQYFVWYYLEHGKNFRPEDIFAGNLLSAIEAVDAGVTTSVDWSHGLQTTDHADAAVDALETVPARFVLAYGNIQAAPWEWTATKEFKDFYSRRFDARETCWAFRSHLTSSRDPSSPSAPPSRSLANSASRSIRTRASGGERRRQHPPDARTRLYDARYGATSTVPRCPTTPTIASPPVAARCRSATESEQSAGQGYPSSWQLRQFGIPISLSHDTSVWWSADLFTAMRTTLGADRSREHFEAHAKGETVTQLDVRAEHVVDWATRGGSRPWACDDKIGSIEVGKRADIVLIKNDESPVMFPIVNPFGHVAMQAQRADVHTVVIDGNILKHEHRLIGIDLDKARSSVEETVEFLADTLGEVAWDAGMHPDLPRSKRSRYPYHYNK